MSDPTILSALRGAKFFQNIEEKHLQKVCEIAKYVEYPARAEIFHEYDKAADVYVIISGRVSLDICEPKLGCRQLMELRDGELIAWSPLVGRPRLSDTARTVTPVQAVVLGGQQLLDLCRSNPEFGFEFMHRVAIVLSERLGATRIQLLKATGFRLPEFQIESD